MGTSNLPSTANPPPLASGPFTTSVGTLTANSLSFLQTLWAMAYAAYQASIDTVSLAPPTGLIAEYTPAVWTPAIAGDGTAGTGTYATQVGLALSIGPLTIAFFNVALTGSLAGAAGNVIIAGLPQVPAPAQALQAGWLASWSGATLTSGYTQLGVAAQANGDIGIYESGSTHAAAALATSALGAGAAFVGAACFFR